MLRIVTKLRVSMLKAVRMQWVRFLVVAALGIVVFTLGMFTGEGRIQLNLFSSIHPAATGLPAQLNYQTVNDVYDALKNNYNGQLTATQLTDGLKHGLAEATGDPYTEYFTAAEAKAFENQLNNSFTGIGAALGGDSSGDLIVVAPIKGSPAEAAGILPNDVIASIDSDSTTGMPVDIAAAKIRGPQGTKVTLKIIRNRTQSLTFTITRQNIQLPSVTSKVLDGNIGYLQISSFGDDTARLATAAASSFKKAHVAGIIVDLRNNPGGLLNAAVDIASLWLPAGQTVVSEKGTAGDQLDTANGSDIVNGIPTAVLINGGSASASEILAGALHDNGAAYLIGEQSFGKGVAQQLINFSDGSELKVTVASWYRPNGQNIQKKGITPDEKVVLSQNDSQADNDTQLTAAEQYLLHH